MNDWKKQAAQILGSDDVEKAFLDQSFTFVSNKVRDLMNAPYSLGFEIIHKNDSNTRMVAIFAFKASGELLYVPVFFLNGEIKGQDLMYQVRRKAFVPSDKWADYYLQADVTNEGSGIDKSVSRNQDRGMDLEKLRTPQHGHKSAAENDLLAEMGEVKTVRPVLREFLEQESPEFVEKLAAFVDSDFDFALGLHTAYPDLSVVIPPVSSTQKQASAPDGFEVFTDMDSHVKQASDSEAIVQDIVTKGYHIKDLRKSATINYVVEKGEANLNTVTDPGLYEVTLKDGTQKLGFCAVEVDDMFDSDETAYKDVALGSYDQEMDDIINLPDMVVVYEDGSVFGPKKGIVGDWKENPEKLEFKPIVTSLEAGRQYRIFCGASGKLSRPFKVVMSREKSGVKTVTIEIFSGTPIEIRVNQGIECSDLKAGVFGKDCLFIETKKQPVEDSRDAYPTSTSISELKGSEPAACKDITTLVTRMGVKEATVLYRAGFYSYHTQRGRPVGSYEKMGAELALACRFDLPLEDVEEITKQAKACGSYTFLIAPDFSKQASQQNRVTLMDDPSFDTSINQQFGVEQDYPRHFVVHTSRDRENFPVNRIGDAWDPGLGAGPQDHEGPGLPMSFLMSANPAEIAERAVAMKMPQVFDHGVVGSMVHTYDAVSMVDRWLPKLEDALDAMGRMVFLYYWKPGDFQDAYGLDDMEELENQLLSNFRSMGDMTMNLLKKSSKKVAGPVPVRKSN